MKRIVSIFLILFVFASLSIFSLAIAKNEDTGSQGQGSLPAEDQQGNQQQGEGSEDQGQDEGQGDQDQQQQQEQTQEQTQEQDQEENGLPGNGNGQQLRARTVNELKSMIQEKRDKMIEEIKSMKGNLQKAYENQNQVRTAVQAFLSMEDLVGSVGHNVSKVAREFDNSIQQSIKAEETIRNRNRIVRFFAGGDQETATELQNLVDQNRIRLQQLKDLKGQCDCEEEVKTLMQKQIQSMEQGQTRLQEMVQNEKDARGIWGWFKGLFGK